MYRSNQGRDSLSNCLITMVSFPTCFRHFRHFCPPNIPSFHFYLWTLVLTCFGNLLYHTFMSGFGTGQREQDQRVTGQSKSKEGMDS